MVWGMSAAYADTMLMAESKTAIPPHLSMEQRISVACVDKMTIIAKS